MPCKAYPQINSKVNFMYTSINFKTKKAVKDAILAGQNITIFQPNNLTGQPEPRDGKVFLEGPHYPEPHRWYGQGQMADGRLVKIT